MTDVNEFVENFLKHEYNPVKAREYYLRTRKLKGRKPGSSADRLAPGSKAAAPKANPRSKIAYNGNPLKPLGQRMEEDETPEVSPSGAKLVDYDGKGLGKATYADGSVYDPLKAWQMAGTKAAAAARTKNAAETAKNTAPRKRRIGAAEQKLIRAKTLAKRVKDPSDRAELLKRLQAAEKRLKAAKLKQPAARRGLRE